MPRAVPYLLDAEDPRNHRPPGYEVWCVACGVHSDLVLHGTTFLCADRELCQFRVRRIVERQAPDPQLRRNA